MVSLRVILFNLLQTRRTPKCVVKIGKGTRGSPYLIASESTDRLIIGKYCSLAHGAIFVLHPGHVPPKGFEGYRVAAYPLARIGRHGFLRSYYIPEKRNYVIVGNDVTIGANAILLPGVTIGDGAIIGAGAVVTHDVPPYAIVAGVPGKVLKYRFTQEQIKKLLEIRWWDWSEEKIVANMDDFYGKVDAFIDKFHEKIGRDPGRAAKISD